MNVVVLTTVHPRDDNRVFHKEIPVICAVHGNFVTAVVADGLGDEIRDSYKVLDLGESNGRMSRFILGNWRAFSCVRKLSPDVVHFHDPELIFLGLLFSILNIKVVFDVHENVPEDIKDKYWIPTWLRGAVSLSYNLIEALCVRFFAAVVGATPDICERYAPDRTVLLQNFPRLEEFATDYGDCSELLAQDMSVVYVGAITRIRGIDNIIKSLSLVDCSKPVRFKLAGFFQEEGHQQDFEKLPGWKYVDFVGKVSREEIGPFLSDAKAGLITFLPANNHINAQPNKLFEYMAAGIPVIASDFPLWRKLIERYNCGYLVDPKSPESIAEAIRAVQENPEVAKSKGLNGKSAIHSELNWEVESCRLINLYKELEQQVLDSQQ
jgi:glycosyltransferase involved in cell wall biosynthesis